MNQKTIQKLNLFFSGLVTRYAENEALFKEIRFSFKSGLKSFPGKVEARDGLRYHFKGAAETMGMKAILDRVLAEAPAYDSLKLIYEERGSVMEIEADDRDVRVKNREITAEPAKLPETSPLLNRTYLINHQKARALLTELDILTQDGKLRNDKIRKYSQIDHYVEILQKDLEKFRNAKHTVHVVDCGCGKSYLSFVLNYYMTEVMKIKTTFTGIDISEKVIETSRQMADRLGYRNMTFIQGDIRTLTTRQRPDIVMSLHACDTATDLALNFGIRNKADLIIAVPCCHAEMNRKFSYEPFESMLKHGILKRRLADVLTDGVRCLLLEQEGYDTTIMEYISPLETPKNLMIRASRTGRRSDRAEAEILNLILKLNYAPALYRYLNDLDDPSDETFAEHESE
ncbi:Methyltransferase domain protein [anaerobic digester metagenome]